MSYGLFQNTQLDLDECEAILQNMCDGDDEPALSKEETQAAVKLITSCFNIVNAICDKANELDMHLHVSDFDRNTILELLKHLNKE